MRHTYFEICNFKGIKKIRLNFDSQPKSKIYTLVGLNESGKTTVLEAINFLDYRSETLDPLNLPSYSVKNVYDLIPISKRSNFNEKITVETGYELNDEDKNKIKRFCETKLSFCLTHELKNFSITQSYSFRDSELELNQPNYEWSLEFIGKKKKGRKERQLDGEEWLEAIEFVKTLLPSILYFPNFLFEFPDKIYLEETPSNKQKHALYQTIIQDVLDSVGGNMNIKRHILDRAKDGSQNARSSLESVLLKMGSHISETVSKNWDHIFKRKSTNSKEIVVSYDRDDREKWFLQFRVKDGNELYSISERSLGFRWFFAFLLLTHYRGFRNDGSRNVLFLFDEPASNLHSSAQSQLLKSFGNFPDNCSIIYTTHSHHLINPEWLESTYVVKNEGLNYDNEDSYNARNTIVTLHKYREFASKHPDQSTYFQPVLDILDYCPSKLENIPNVVMVEGKNDFYTLRYFQEIILDKKIEFHFLPGGGAGSLDSIIRLYIAWGRSFIVLLDGDQEGLEQKKRYRKVFEELIDNRVFSLEDVNKNWKQKELELLIDEDDLIAIQKLHNPQASKFNKSKFNRSLQELYLMKQTVSVSDTTKSHFTELLDFCKLKLQENLSK